LVDGVFVKDESTENQLHIFDKKEDE